jgi:pimeloyl-ACP methyl ester carboxylesterase
MNATETVNKRSCLGWIGRILAGLLIFLFLLVGSILAGGAIARARIQANYPPPGQMVDVGGGRLHIFCMGEGSPTVMVLAGSGIPSIYYSLIQSEASRSTRVCVYDRAGYAWSETGIGDLSPNGQVEDLKALFEGVRIHPPYIFVGHSYGGYIARLYAKNYPDEVSGLVMVDSTHEDQWQSFPEPIKEMGERMFTGHTPPLNVFLAVLLRSFQALMPSTNPLSEYFPPDVAETLMAVQKLHPSIIYTVKAEVSQMVAGESPRVTDLGDLPMIVITHGIPLPLMGHTEDVNREYEQIHLAMQEALLSLSTNSKQVIAEQSNHDEIPVLQADLVVQAILEVISQVK